MRRVYLDHNATTPVDPRVLDAMLPFLRDDFGNPSSLHWFGQRARAAVEEARASVAALVGADPAEIVFTASGSESDNMALRGAATKAVPARTGVACSAIEHHAVLNTAKAMRDEGRPSVRRPEDARRADAPVALSEIDPFDLARGRIHQAGLDRPAQEGGLGVRGLGFREAGLGHIEGDDRLLAVGARFGEKEEDALFVGRQLQPDQGSALGENKGLAPGGLEGGGEGLGVAVQAVRRHGIRATDPTPETRLGAGDVLILRGGVEAIETAKLRLGTP